MPLPRDLIAFTDDGWFITEDWELALVVVTVGLTVTVVVVVVVVIQLEQSIHGEEQYEGHAQA